MLDHEIKATPESYYTSTLSPIVLSETEHVQVSFAGKQVDHYADTQKNIKGKLVIKKKAKNEQFTAAEKFGRKNIKVHDWVEIELDTDETYNLMRGLISYYKCFSGKLTNPAKEMVFVEKSPEYERLKALFSDRDDLASILAHIDTNTINTVLNIENLKRIQRVMKENMDNDDEERFWQPFFEQNNWILSQLFHAPVMFFKGKRYVGGKGIEGRGGQNTDFVYKNDITDNVAIIEIKSPRKPILDSKYRQAFKVSSEISGGIAQLLLQKDNLVKQYASLLMNTDEYFRATNVDSYLVCGTVSNLDKKEKDAYENFRNELRSVHLIGFDELLRKVENLLKLLEGNPDTPNTEAEFTVDDIPF